jgi:predicted MPP superfamily phosphohydrolase
MNSKRFSKGRRQTLISLATLTAGAILKPTSVFGVENVKNKLRFAVIGDWGTGDANQFGVAGRMLTAHQGAPFDFVLSAGDNIYPDGRGKHIAGKFEKPFAGLIKDRVPFYTVLGNHDVEKGRDDQRQYPLFNMGGCDYYTVSKDDGLADFFMLDSTDFTLEQAGWLEKALAASTARWKIAVFHHPLYSSGRMHGPNLKLRAVLEPLLTRYKVNAVFSGHDHIYERTKPQNGIQYFVTGGGGKNRNNGVDWKSSCLAVSYSDDNHFMVIEADDRQISFKAIAETGVEIDRGVIK